jgi:hypothetical protein
MPAVAYIKLPVIVKLAPQPGFDSEICSVNRPLPVNLGGFFLHPMRGEHWRENQPMTESERRIEIFRRFSVRILEKCFS